MYHPLKNGIHSSQAAVSFDGALNSKYYIIQSVSQLVSSSCVQWDNNNNSRRRSATHKRRQESRSRLISHIVLQPRALSHSYYYNGPYIFHGVPLNIFIRKMFSIRTSSPIHTANKVSITCSFNIFKCEHDDDYIILRRR